MDEGLLVARLFLATVFAIAGLTKLIDRQGTRRALAEFGVPSRLTYPTALALPLTETLAALALIPTSTALGGTVAAIGLLILFTAAVGLNLALGRRPNCHCFGHFRSAPISLATLVRNAALAIVAGILLWLGRDDMGISLFGWLGDTSAGELLLFAGATSGLLLLAVEAWLLIYLLKQYGTLVLRLDETQRKHGDATQVSGLPVGTPAPDFSLVDVHGARVSLADVRAPTIPTVLVFSNSNCAPCNELLPAIGEWQHEFSNRLTIVVVGGGDVEVNRQKALEHAIDPMLQQEGYEVNDAYRAQVTPSAVLIRPDGTIGSELAAGGVAIRNLLRESAAQLLLMDFVPPDASDWEPMRGNGPQIAHSPSGFS